MENQDKLIKNNKNPFIVGLTGGIGSGKTLVAQILKPLGAYIIDTDVVSKAVSQSGSECDQKLKAAFPACVSDGILQRPLLKNLVFKDEKALKLLNSITHPYIIAETMRQAEGKEIVFIQVPLLFESGFDKLCDVTVGVVASESLRKNRVEKRDNMSFSLFKSIVAAQLSNAELAARCDFVLENNGSIHQLEDNVEKLFLKIKQFAANPAQGFSADKKPAK